MKILRALLVTLFAICLAGCLPTSKNPLSTPDDAVLDSRLNGVWFSESGGDKVYLHFGKGSGRTMNAVEVDHEKDGGVKGHFYTVFTSEIDGVNHLNIRPEEGGEKVYYFARYGVDSGDVLRVWLMSEKPVVKAIKAGKLKGTVSGKDDGDIKITDTPANIARFVRNSDRMVLFAEKFGEFKRLSK
jgi:hypothetical protein